LWQAGCVPATYCTVLYCSVQTVCGSAGGTVVQIGACDDKVTAADTAKLSATAYTGAATYAFIETIERYGTDQTYANLLINMTRTLSSLGKASVKPQSAGGAMASGALPLVGAIVLGPLGLLAGAALGTSLGKLCACDKLLLSCAVMCANSRDKTGWEVEAGAEAM
jgi:hypothetical protein